MQDLIGPIHAALDAGESVTLSCVVGRRGSLPMSRRARMLVLGDGRCLGTVGGGCLEAEVYARGRELMRSGGARLDSYNLTEVEDGLDGHVCGGTVTILSDALAPAPATRELFIRLAELIAARLPALLATAIPEQPTTDGGAGHLLLEADGSYVADGLVPGPELLRLGAEALSAGASGAAELTADGQRYWLDPLVPAPTAAIFGAGHCGRAIGRAAAEVGFRVVVLDDREPFLDRDAMPWAAELRRIDFESDVEVDSFGPAPYLVIVTRGHDHDLALLRQLAGRPAAYLGMIGSRRKRALFERELAREGVGTQQLARLRSPMGLDIGADTPEEIAVSVVAEMIATRRNAVRGEETRLPVAVEQSTSPSL